MHIRSHGTTHVGLVRACNEDSYAIGEAIAVVADGMGGHAAGDVASRLAVEAFQALPDELDVDALHRALEDANRAIIASAENAPERTGMGTTVTGIAAIEFGGQPHWLVFNVGDSRVYRLEGSQVVQLTVDHSEVAELIAQGRLTAAQARVHPLRNVVTRSLGSEPPPQVDTWVFPSHQDDLFLVCSDGLTGELTDDEIGAIVQHSSSLADGVQRLVGEALARGGHDNITAILLAPAEERLDQIDDQTPTVPRKGVRSDHDT